jgi:hypothetical protein
LQRISRGVLAFWLTGIAGVGLLVNWRGQVWSQLTENVVNSVYANTDPAQPIMADQPATVKFLNELHGQRMLVDLDLNNESSEVRGDQFLRLLNRNKMVQIVLFGRDDSDYWLSKSKNDEVFINAILQQLHPALKLHQRFPGLSVLRMWNVRI